MQTDLNKGDVVNVLYTNAVDGDEREMRVTVTDPDDDTMNEGPSSGFKGQRHSDNKEVGVWFDGPVCTFGYKQSTIGENASVEVALESRN